jgi:rubrerythrin
MESLDLAKNIEKEGKEYYEKLAKESPERSLSGVFAFLAKEEQHHYDIFDALQKKQPVRTEPGTVSAEAKKMFAGLSSHFALPEMFYDYAAAYMRALEMERKSVALYDGMLAKASSKEERKILSFLILEEQKHEHLMEHMIEFVNKPNVFLETAEFNHLEDEEA